jgi:hypothetical protein
MWRRAVLVSQAGQDTSISALTSSFCLPCSLLKRFDRQICSTTLCLPSVKECVLYHSNTGLLLDLLSSAKTGHTDPLELLFHDAPEVKATVALESGDMSISKSS